MRYRGRSRRCLLVAMITVLVSGSAIATSAEPAEALSSFTDVQPDAYYAEAVSWLADQAVTTGTAPSTFSPDEFVTRGQMATFLDRFARMRSSTSYHPFTDLDPESFYAASVARLHFLGITTGTSDSTFSPDELVTRGQMAAFLWRLAGRPPATTIPPFVDVPSDAFYAEPVSWLVAVEVTTGTSPTTFSPDDPVTRGQMAAFLWRMAGRPEPGDEGRNRVAAGRVASTGGDYREAGFWIRVEGATAEMIVRADPNPLLETSVLDPPFAQPPVEITFSGGEPLGPVAVAMPIDPIVFADTPGFKIWALDSYLGWQELPTPDPSYGFIEIGWPFEAELTWMNLVIDATTPTAVPTNYSSATTFAAGPEFRRYAIGISIVEPDPPLPLPDDIACPVPSNVAVRGDMALTLWRLAGEPAVAQPASDLWADVPVGSVYDDAAGYVYSIGILIGTSPTTFSPLRPLLRGEYIAYLYRLAGLPSGSPPSPFVDVEPSKWYSAAVDWGASIGVPGTSATTFSPLSYITNQEAAVFVDAYLGHPDPPTFDYFDCSGFPGG